MILALCGTQKQSFERLWFNIRPLLASEEWIIQSGHNKWETDLSHVKIVNFVPNEQLLNWLEQADLIITHAGAGSMLQAIQMKKKIIAVPRLKKYKEHVNDHQLELAQKFESLGYLKVLNSEDNLKTLIDSMTTFHPTSYQSNNPLIPHLTQRFEEILSKK